MFDLNKQDINKIGATKSHANLHEYDLNNQIEKRPQYLLAKVLVENEPNRESKVEYDNLIASLDIKEEKLEHLIDIIKESKQDESFEIRKNIDPNEAKRILGNYIF